MRRFALAASVTTHCCHDVIKWKHFPRYWPFVRGMHRSPVNSPHKGQWRWAVMFSMICPWLKGCINNGEAGDLRRQRLHYDVTVMTFEHPVQNGMQVCIINDTANEYHLWYIKQNKHMLFLWLGGYIIGVDRFGNYYQLFSICLYWGCDMINIKVESTDILAQPSRKREPCAQSMWYTTQIVSGVELKNINLLLSV